MDNLHSPKDDAMEERDRRSFSQVVLLAGIVLMGMLLAALLMTGRIGNHIRVVRPDAHPTSRLVMGTSNSRLA